MQEGLSASGPVGRKPRGDQVVVLRGIPWEQYDALCRVREDAAGPRMAYLDGTLEIMSPARIHEHHKKLIARLVEAYGDERGIDLNGFGSETYRRKAEDAGIEPDECYCVGDAKEIPDFAIEVINTSGGLNKLEIYRRLKVPEVWIWARERFWIYRLSGRRYVEVPASSVLPGFDLAACARIVASTEESQQAAAARAWRKMLREKVKRSQTRPSKTRRQPRR
jgi:Uma2 family endonuclease